MRLGGLIVLLTVAWKGSSATQSMSSAYLEYATVSMRRPAHWGGRALGSLLVDAGKGLGRELVPEVPEQALSLLCEGAVGHGVGTPCFQHLSRV